ncbi:hypothetical protein NECAME_09833 [Necator americanus]|uniref:Uncharacterized protein n=1 Tax=Necator americanus TaxID=51031 RepID=W2TBL5_NECAM|nr:hypothetical protein NECAME_09833 [Necator americanus]ETN79430.1 hypothetical protein NECAME_09833 [Necator americanus]
MIWRTAKFQLSALVNVIQNVSKIAVSSYVTVMKRKRRRTRKKGESRRSVRDDCSFTVVKSLEFLAQKKMKGRVTGCNMPHLRQRKHSNHRESSERERERTRTEMRLN